MAVYEFAGLRVGVKLKNEFTARYMQDYLVEGDDCDFEVEVTDEMIAYEREHAEEGASARYYEPIAILRAVCDRMIAYDGFFLHCSCLMIDGGAIIFTAPSGTGKSTHARLWRAHFGDRVTMINDDKPLVRRIDGVWRIYGTPWNGKHSISNNISAPIRAIFFLEQGKENVLSPVRPFDALTLLLRQTVIPATRDDMSKLLDMLSGMMEQASLHRLSCTISDEAVTTALSALSIE